MLTRSGKTIEVPEGEEGRPEYGTRRKVTTYYGASFRHVAAPTKPVVGVVRDKDTKKPLARVEVRSYAKTTGRDSFEAVHIVRTTSDAEGLYRLVGMPKGDGYKIVVIPNDDQPYVITNRDVPNSPGLDPVTVDFELKRSVWIEGKLTDKVTGKPLRGAVEYFSLSGNPNLSDYRGFDGTILTDHMGVAGKEDGSYRVAGLPGPGLVAVRSVDHYLRFSDRDDEYGTKQKTMNTAPYGLIFPENYAAIARIDVAKGVDSVKRDATLDPGATFTGTVLGLDGAPLPGARGFGLTGAHWGERGEHTPMKWSQFNILGFNPRRPRDIIFQHLEKGLVGIAELSKAKGDSVSVQMEPGAVVTGRLIDANGQPRAGIELDVWFLLKAEFHWIKYFPDPVNTDREGRFRIGALLSSYDFRLSDHKVDPFGRSDWKARVPVGGGLRSGQTKDLGDVRFKAVPKFEF